MPSIICDEHSSTRWGVGDSLLDALTHIVFGQRFAVGDVKYKLGGLATPAYGYGQAEGLAVRDGPVACLLAIVR